jgi:hypothetical protein
LPAFAISKKDRLVGLLYQLDALSFLVAARGGRSTPAAPRQLFRSKTVICRAWIPSQTRTFLIFISRHGGGRDARDCRAKRVRYPFCTTSRYFRAG